MANPNGAGTTFVSVNLNKSYGPVSNRNNNNNSSYGQAAAGRGRGGGGMVVLSCAKSSVQKPGPKLSVPPPLNLPSLRKENQRFDLSAPGCGSGGAQSSATRLNSSSVGWTKPASNLQDLSNDSVSVDKLEQNGQNAGVGDGGVRGGSDYIPPSVRIGGAGLVPSLPEKAAILIGEDFPSLKAALPKEATHHQKQKQLSRDESANEQRNMASSSQIIYGNGSNGSESYGLGNLPLTSQARKKELFPGPLPLVRLNPRSDWADDERDTRHGFVDRSKDYGYSNNEAYWDRDFDMPKNRVLPHKLADNQFQRWGKREDESVRTAINKVLKIDPFVRTPSRESNSWRASPLPKDGYDAVGGRTMDLNRENGRDDKYVPRVGEYSRGNVTVNQDFNNGRRDGFGKGHQRYHTVESSNSRVNDRNKHDFYGNEQSSRYKSYSLQNNSMSKSSFSPNGKGFSVNDSVQNIGHEKRPFSNGERTNPIDAFVSPSSFDEHDPFSSGLVRVIKKKKDVVKQADFHDPVREFFEAELEKVQKMQEQERQRIAEEQERALEQARREEEERHKLIREEEEQRTRVEDATREAAWREEQERHEAIRQAEEQKIAREEEKRNMIMEEERRKQAAKQKLLELEARMAKRKTETVQDNSSAAMSDDKGTTSVVEKDTSRVADFVSWEDSERMVERIMTPGSSDSSGPNISFEPGYRSQSSREGDSGFVDRLKPVNPWRRDVLESGNNSSFIDHDNGHYSPRRDGSVLGRAFSKKVFHGGPGYMPSRSYNTGGNKYNYAEDNPYSRSMDTDSEFHDNVPEKYVDGGCGQGRFQGNVHPPYPERRSSEGDELYPYGRSRYSMRQPCVLPPPSLVPTQKNVLRGENERPGPSAFMPYNSSPGNESNMQMGYYNGPRERVEASEIADVQQQNNVAQKLMEKDSHDDFDESGDSPTVSDTEGKLITVDTISAEDNVVAESGLISDADEDWSVGNNEELQEQEEYDEDEDGYQEEDEVHEGDDDNIALNQEFDDLHIAEKGSPDMMENLVLGFDEGVELRLPSGYGERSFRNEESAFRDQEKPVDEKQGKIPTSRCTHEADIKIPDSTIQSRNTDPRTVPSCDPLDTVENSSVNIASYSFAGQTVMPTVPVGSSPIDLPIKLQFGLFTGPPLIPSPIQAIQIGSIQMPLHIHPSVTQIHQLQAPLFQFGKLRFTAPISQGIVPIAPQMSFVQPNVQVRYNLNQNSVGQLSIQPKQEGLANNKIIDEVSTSSMGGGSNVVQREVAKVAKANENNYMPEAGDKEQWFTGQENYRQANGTALKAMQHSENLRSLRAHGQQSGFKSERYAYMARNSNVRSAFPAPEAARLNSGGLQRRTRRTAQRTEFRVRENVDNRPSFTGRNVGVFVRSAPKKGSMANKSAGRMVELEPSTYVQQTNIDSRVGSKLDKESSSRVENNSHLVEASLKINLVSDEEVDAPLQSGIVRVFKQPGIEAPSDDDDFIQVRSKRQMLNDRREQKEKEIKAKSRILKAPRNSKSAIFCGGLPKKAQSDVVPECRVLADVEASKVFTSAVSQPLAPIGTPAVTSDGQTDKRPQIVKSLQTGACSAILDSEKDLESGLVFVTKNKILDDVQTSLVSWGNSHINQQTQLDEAMRPDRLDEHVTSTSGHTSSVENPNMLSFSSTASPVNSLLAGEKIQFGAVTSPTVLPPSSHAVSHVIRAPVSSRSDMKISHSLSISESDCSMLFEKEKNQSEPRDCLEDAEAEAEAAASAVAVAAIGSDESVSVSDTKSFRRADINGFTRGMAGDQQLSSQSRAEESLSVALPADLSVETPPMSTWPPLPSPHSSSGQMLSHFPGGPSSPFPFYEMSPMMRGPIFTFGPHDESGGTQSQTQKSNVTGSGPLGPWQQFHSGPDSFYGPPAGFPGSYIGPHGGIPGVQGPPHMVVYNHFPVGQFGHVGLSFMGTTYIPSGKQPDWKHNQAAPNRERDINSINMDSGQHNPSGMASPAQHLAPSSQPLPMPSPLALFDVSRFQSIPDASVPGGWPHVTSTPLHSIPLSMPLQQQETGVLNYSQNQSSTANRFSEPQTSIPFDNTRSFPDALRSVNSSSSNVAGAYIQSSTVAHTAKPDGTQSGGNSNNTSHGINTYKTRALQPRNLPSQQQYNHHSTGYGYQRNRMGYYHGRNNSTVTDKSFPSKMKQIYVPKQTTNSGSSMG